MIGAEVNRLGSTTVCADTGENGGGGVDALIGIFRSRLRLSSVDASCETITQCLSSAPRSCSRARLEKENSVCSVGSRNGNLELLCGI